MSSPRTPHHPPPPSTPSIRPSASLAPSSIDTCPSGVSASLGLIRTSTPPRRRTTASHAPDQSALRVVVRFAKLDALSVIIARIRRMFDLSAEPSAIESALSADPVLAPLVLAQPGLRVPG